MTGAGGPNHKQRGIRAPQPAYKVWRYLLTSKRIMRIIHLKHKTEPGKEAERLVNFSGLQFNDSAPVYQQIAEYLKRQILTGAVQDGEPMPSRRELAAQTGINPNTAQKAYRLMTEEGYVVTDGNSGSYLRLTPALREKIDEELTRGLVEDFVARAKANRLSYKKVIALVSELWDDEA